jgi:hypothetical protein
VSPVKWIIRLVVRSTGRGAVANGRVVKDLLRRHPPDHGWKHELAALRRITRE